MRRSRGLGDVYKRQLHECLDGADSFSRTDSDPRYEACVRCVEQIQHILTHLSSVWRHVMSQEALKKALCDLVDAVFDRVLHEMEDLQDISEPESIRLAQVCRMLMDTAGAVLGGAEADVPTYFKFAYLPLSLIHISEPTRPSHISRMPSSA